MSAVAYPRGRVDHGVEHLLDRGPDTGRSGPLPTATTARAAFPGQREQMRPFRLIELQRVCEGVEHALGGAGEAATFHPDVVVDRDPGEHRDFLAPQPLHAAVAAIRRQARLLGGDARAPRAEELADLGAQVEGAHASTVGIAAGLEGGTGSTGHDRLSRGVHPRR